MRQRPTDGRPLSGLATINSVAAASCAIALHQHAFLAILLREVQTITICGVLTGRPPSSAFDDAMFARGVCVVTCIDQNPNARKHSIM